MTTKEKALLRTCTGDAHKNPRIDNCGICAPYWAEYPICPTDRRALRGPKGDYCPACFRHFDVLDILVNEDNAPAPDVPTRAPKAKPTRALDPALKDRLDAYVAKLTELTKDHFARRFPNLTPPTYTMDIGRRYVRIVRDESPSKSVHTFVDTTNGDVLKADSWKKPAKHPRGNIFNDDYGMDGVSVYGANYLR